MGRVALLRSAEPTVVSRARRVARGRAVVSKEKWQMVCHLTDLVVERGVAALVHGQSVALFRLDDDHVLAVGNPDPYRRGAVLARGIVGRRGDTPFVASTVHGRAFDLATGRCLQDVAVSVPSYEVKVEDGIVYVGGRLDHGTRWASA